MCPGKCEPYMHKGEWAIHEVLPSLLSAMGVADVRIATFSVSEDSLRPLFFLRDEGQINRLTLLLDYTVKRHKLDLLLFAAGFTPDIRIDACHAKVLLVENDVHRFGIVGSANLNQNHRWEAGVWFTSGPMYDHFSKQFNAAYADALPYDTLR
ncbi:MAG TPA: hypothetical protein H9824_06115 [Candidatus Bacteroides pullicola]|uniref:PLD phosphodiesterase domain-containing protein n=1 Tax=Candidatus Bacteroides pullicola TaxID=2838475 RepID=A0A9D1ZI80_9BACE|nr:hypothetical protein [Candidatus Bacteroides pullicola]